MKRASAFVERGMPQRRVSMPRHLERIPFYGFVRSLEAYEKFLDDKSTILLSPGSRLLRFLNDSSAGK
jgi:hypothetical protein